MNNSELKNVLTELYLKYKIEGIINTEGYVFLNLKTNKPYIDIRKPFLLVLEEAKIKSFVFHSLRHSFGSQLAISGVDIVTIKEMLGHSKIITTQRYVHSTEGVKREAIESLPIEAKTHTNTDTTRNIEREGSKHIVVTRV